MHSTTPTDALKAIIDMILTPMGRSANQRARRRAAGRVSREDTGESSWSAEGRKRGLAPDRRRGQRENNSGCFSATHYAERVAAGISERAATIPEMSTWRPIDPRTCHVRYFCPARIL